jgi:hypothetical protein
MLFRHGETRAPSVGSLPSLLDVCDADGYCRSPECEKRRGEAGFSTRSVLLPESLRVCPFGGAACEFSGQRALPTRAANVREGRGLVK